MTRHDNYSLSAKQISVNIVDRLSTREEIFDYDFFEAEHQESTIYADVITTLNCYKNNTTYPLTIQTILYGDADDPTIEVSITVGEEPSYVFKETTRTEAVKMAVESCVLLLERAK